MGTSLKKHTQKKHPNPYLYYRGTKWKDPCPYYKGFGIAEINNTTIEFIDKKCRRFSCAFFFSFI